MYTIKKNKLESNNPLSSLLHIKDISFKNLQNIRYSIDFPFKTQDKIENGSKATFRSKIDGYKPSES